MAVFVKRAVQFRIDCSPLSETPLGVFFFGARVSSRIPELSLIAFDFEACLSFFSPKIYPEQCGTAPKVSWLRCSALIEAWGMQRSMLLLFPAVDVSSSVL